MALERFGDEIWIADGSNVSVAGFRYPTRMAVIRLSDGGLFIWSPIALSEGLRAAIDALGPVRHVVAPNRLHHLFIGEWRQAYLQAKIYAAPGLRERRSDIAFDGDLGDSPPPDWSDDVDQVIVRGNRITSEVVFFHRQSRTVIFTDLIQQFDSGWFTGWRALIARLDLMTSPSPAVPRKFRMAFGDRDLARDALRWILSWPAERELMAHGAQVHRDGRSVIANAFTWLLD